MIRRKKVRWEPLAVGLFVSTELLQKQQKQEPTNEGGGTPSSSTTVYMDGPRVPSVHAAPAAAATLPQLSVQDAAALSATLHAQCRRHLEHPEPRVRTLVAQAVGAYCRLDGSAGHAREMHAQLVASIHQHIVEGRRDDDKATATGTGKYDGN